MQIETNGGDEFEEFVNAGEVEVGKSANASVDEGDDEKKPAAKSRPPKEAEPKKAADAAPDEEEDDQEQPGGGDDDEEEDGEKKPKKTAAEHQIERLKREKRDLQRQLRQGANSDISRRLEVIESRLTGGNGNDTKPAAKPAPDPSDADKVPTRTP
jgi:hypothetical protein